MSGGLALLSLSHSAVICAVIRVSMFWHKQTTSHDSTQTRFPLSRFVATHRAVGLSKASQASESKALQASLEPFSSSLLASIRPIHIAKAAQASDVCRLLRLPLVQAAACRGLIVAKVLEYLCQRRAKECRSGTFEYIK